MSPETRSWIYKISAALVPLFVTLGLVTDEVAGQVLAVIGAVLSTSTSILANKNVDKTK
jgi:urea transporter